MTRLKANSRSASTPDARVTEMINGLLVSKQAKKIEEVEVTEAKTTTTKGLDLTKDGPVLQSKAVSFPGINKVKEIHDFLNASRY